MTRIRLCILSMAPGPPCLLPRSSSSSLRSSSSTDCGGSDLDDDALLPSSGPSLPPELVTKLLRKLLPVLWLGYVFNILDRSNLGYAQLQMADDLHATPQAFGLASGIFFLGYAMLQLPLNHAVPRLGARRVLSTCMVCWGILSASAGLVDSVGQLCVLRFALGLAESGFFPGCLLYLTAWFPSS